MSDGRRVRLVVLFGGRSAEHDVSCVTAVHVLKALDPDRYDVVPIGITHAGQWVVADDVRAALTAGRDLPKALTAAGTSVDPVPALAPTDDEAQVVVLPLLHGPFGEDGTVQGLLELADVPYVGSGVLGSAVAMDKVTAKQLTAQAGIPQAKWLGFRDDELDAGTAVLDRIEDELGLPVFVKPANLGSSVGVSKARDAEQLAAALDVARSYDEWIVVEEAITGREIEVAVLGNFAPEASVPGEVVPGADFYSYEDKYVDDAAVYQIPAPLDPEATDEVRALAIKAFRALRCEGLARVDFFYEEGGRGFLLNEVNTMPGFTPISMYPKLWQASGLSYPDLLDRLVELGIERHRRRGGRLGRERG